MKTQGKIVEGILAISKPPDITSAQVIRDLQEHFNPSKLFAPWLDAEVQRRARENNYQKRRRRNKGPQQVKIGHGGTLDPLATGVLIIGIGKGTKQLDQFLRCKKVYEAVFHFGVDTDTYDRTGKVVSRSPYSHVTRDRVESCLDRFRGSIMQRPPIFSALRHEGKRLYEYAREGKKPPVEIQERPVQVIDLEILDWYAGGSHDFRWPKEQAPAEIQELARHIDDGSDRGAHMEVEESIPPGNKKRKRADDNESGQKSARLEDGKARTNENERDRPVTETSNGSSDGAANIASVNEEPSSAESGEMSPAVKLRMTVSSGFYVRSLCHDLGLAVGSAASMSTLVRTKQADYELGKNVFDYDDLNKGEEVWGPQVERLLELSQQNQNLD